MAIVDSQPDSADASHDEEQVWRLGRVEGVLVWIPVAALPAFLLIAGDVPIGVALAVVAVGALFALSHRRPFVRITEDELVVRNVLHTTHIPRLEVETAYFTYYNFVIRKRDGGKVRSRLAPKWSSTELSGDQPPPDSPAYRITRWARGESGG